MKQLDDGSHGLRSGQDTQPGCLDPAEFLGDLVRRTNLHVDEQKSLLFSLYCTLICGGPQVRDQLEVGPTNVFTLHMRRQGTTADFGESILHVLSLVIWAFRDICDHFFVGFAVTGHIDGNRNSRILVSEVLPDGLAFSEGASSLNPE